jgi:hypothetical protein
VWGSSWGARTYRDRRAASAGLRSIEAIERRRKVAAEMRELRRLMQELRADAKRLAELT